MTNVENSILVNNDSYKQSHYLQYPPNTTNISSYIEPRWNKEGHEEIVFFGLQAFIKEYLKPITHEENDFARDFWASHGEPYNYEGYKRIINERGGILPIEIQALPEGTVHGLSVPQVQIFNTDNEHAYITSSLETELLRAVWYPSTVATTSWRIKRVIKSFLEKTCDDYSTVLPFRLHDFGARGASSRESAGIGGMSHLVNFMGSDTATSIHYTRKYYNQIEMPAYSIPASEHSTMTSWGEIGEVNAFRNMIKQFAGPGKIYACVSDSYDLFRAVGEHWGTTLKDEIINAGGVLVIRPDSGNPTIIPIQVIEMLGEKFGFTVNNKGFKVLHPSIRVIQSDGVNEKSITIILQKLYDLGWSAENIAFGMGGALLQSINRDTYGYAMKCNAIKNGGEWIPVMKKPKTDPNKNSKAGYIEGLTTVWRNGELLVDHNFNDIRERANSYL